jgi:hypothetical protein
MTMPELPDDAQMAAMAAHARDCHERALAVETELRTTRLRFAPMLCTCSRGDPGECLVHGQFLILPDGRVL